MRPALALTGVILLLAGCSGPSKTTESDTAGLDDYYGDPPGGTWDPRDGRGPSATDETPPANSTRTPADEDQSSSKTSDLPALAIAAGPMVVEFPGKTGPVRLRLDSAEGFSIDGASWQGPCTGEICMETWAVMYPLGHVFLAAADCGGADPDLRWHHDLSTQLGTFFGEYPAGSYVMEVEPRNGEYWQFHFNDGRTEDPTRPATVPSSTNATVFQPEVLTTDGTPATVEFEQELQLAGPGFASVEFRTNQGLNLGQGELELSVLAPHGAACLSGQDAAPLLDSTMSAAAEGSLPAGFFKFRGLAQWDSGLFVSGSATALVFSLEAV